MAVYLLTHPPPHFHSPTSLSSVSCVLFGSFNMTDGCLFIKNPCALRPFLSLIILPKPF